MTLTVIAMVHDRGDRGYYRIRNFLVSLLQQELPPDEIIIVNTSETECFQPQIGELSRINYILRPSPAFNKSRALNIGIKRSTSDYIMTTDIDFIFSPNVIQTVTDRLNDKTFVLSEAGYLPDVPVAPPFDWSELELLVDSPEHRKSPGTVQAAHRQFWFNVHGYDEQFDGGLGGMDDDMWIRGRKYGLELDWIPFGEVACLHQWHPVSDLKGVCSHLFMPNPEIIKNLTGWGE